MQCSLWRKTSDNGQRCYVTFSPSVSDHQSWMKFGAFSIAFSLEWACCWCEWCSRWAIDCQLNSMLIRLLRRPQWLHPRPLLQSWCVFNGLLCSCRAGLFPCGLWTHWKRSGEVLFKFQVPNSRSTRKGEPGVPRLWPELECGLQRGKTNSTSLWFPLHVVQIRRPSQITVSLVLVMFCVVWGMLMGSIAHLRIPLSVSDVRAYSCCLWPYLLVFGPQSYCTIIHTCSIPCETSADCYASEYGQQCVHGYCEYFGYKRHIHLSWWECSCRNDAGFASRM